MRRRIKQAVAKAISEHDFKHVEWIAAGEFVSLSSRLLYDYETTVLSSPVITV